MTRTQRGLDRARARKDAKDPGHVVPPGPSLLSSLESKLLAHTVEYLRRKNAYEGDPVELAHSEAVQRGIVRGLAMGVALIRVPYEDQKAATRAVEREFLSKAKEEM